MASEPPTDPFPLHACSPPLEYAPANFPNHLRFVLGTAVEKENERRGTLPAVFLLVNFVDRIHLIGRQHSLDWRVTSLMAMTPFLTSRSNYLMGDCITPLLSCTWVIEVAAEVCYLLYTLHAWRIYFRSAGIETLARARSWRSRQHVEPHTSICLCMWNCGRVTENVTRKTNE